MGPDRLSADGGVRDAAERGSPGYLLGAGAGVGVGTSTMSRSMVIVSRSSFARVFGFMLGVLSVSCPAGWPRRADVP